MGKWKGKLERRWNLLRQQISVRRYGLDRNARRFAVQTLKALPPAPDPAKRRLVLFAHFDRKDEVDPYVAFYLKSLFDAGSTIIFVSGSPRLKRASAESIKPYCGGIYTRRTLGLDFGSWHLAWAMMEKRGWKLESFDQMVWANDSVYGPLFNIETMFSRFSDADLYGVTENNEHVPHLQSYFLLWDLNERTIPFLRQFWSDFRYILDKDELIQVYEIGISTAAREAGLRVKAYISDAEARSAELAEGDERAEAFAGQAVNNPLKFWDTLISANHCPFLKVSLVTRDGLLLQTSLPDFLRRWTEYDPRLIEEHYRRISGAS